MLIFIYIEILYNASKSTRVQKRTDLRNHQQARGHGSKSLAVHALEILTI
jgi:hypothetical protein